MLGVMTHNWTNCLFLVMLVEEFLNSCSCNSESTWKNNFSLQGSAIVSPSVYHGPTGHPKFGILHTLARYTEWAVREERLVTVLSQRQKLVREELGILERYLKNYTDTYDKVQQTGNKPEGPSRERVKQTESRGKLNHDSVHRYVTEGHTLRRLIMSPGFKENQKDVQTQLKIVNPSNWMFAEYVGWDDLYMSMNSFVHFSEVYAFQVDKMIEGLQLDSHMGGNLTALHAAELGVFTLYRRKYSISIEWLELTRQMLGEEFKDRGVTLDVVSPFLAVAIQQHNRVLLIFEDVREEDKELVLLSLYDYPITADVLPEDRMSLRYKVFTETQGLGENATATAQFMDLCLENEPQTPEMQRNLKCFYEKKRHPYLYINPVKVEQLSESPPILQFYEMVGNATIEKIKRDHGNNLVLSGVVGTAGVEQVTERRTSVGMFVMKSDRYLQRSYSLAEAVSGLRIRGAADPIQFVEYTYGRYYTHHRDAFVDDGDDVDITVKLDGNRLATMLYYLDLPDMGGVTPFCQAGVSGRPVRGSAILWYGLYRNGSIRNDVEHGSCPVMHGHKIIMNHWIRYFGNWKTFPCSLNQFE